MEDIVPPLLHAIREIRWALSTGHSTKDAVQIYLGQTQDPLASQLRHAWIAHQQGGDRPKFDSFREHTLWSLIERGLNGQPIHDALLILEKDTEDAATHYLDAHLAKLPFKILVPLMFLQFPAYLLVLLGPVLRELNSQMGG